MKRAQVSCQEVCQSPSHMPVSIAAIRVGQVLIAYGELQKPLSESGNLRTVSWSLYVLVDKVTELLVHQPLKAGQMWRTGSIASAAYILRGPYVDEAIRIGFLIIYVLDGIDKRQDANVIVALESSL